MLLEQDHSPPGRFAAIQRWRRLPGPPVDPWMFEDPTDFEVWCHDDAEMPSWLDESMATQIATKLNGRRDGHVYRVWLAPSL